MLTALMWMCHFPVMPTNSELQRALKGLREKVTASQKALLGAWQPVLADSGFEQDAANLSAYIVLRREDIRTFQEQVSELDLSSLGRCEGHDIATLDAVAKTKNALNSTCPTDAELSHPVRANRQGDKRLKQNTHRLLGKELKHRRSRIMVTSLNAAAGEMCFVSDLIERGMDVAHINCAHDDAAVWWSMIDNIRAAAKVSDKTCLIHMDPAGPKLRTDEMAAMLPALGEKDLLDLDFVAQEADKVGGFSIEQTATDMDSLSDALEPRGAGNLGRIAKIETQRAVVNLPKIGVHGASWGPFGLMIARGELAVEIDCSRLSEIQEEILWLAEAAHVPVIWATQVFEQLIKENLPSWAEMTDAAMSECAECVMLNKGPFVLDAIAMLDDIARRMRAHQHKKSARLRALHW